MRFELKYGKQTLAVSVPDGVEHEVLSIHAPPPAGDEASVLGRALDSPIRSDSLERIVGKDDTVAIVTSDVTRPMPSARVLPSVLDRVARAGVPPANVTIVFALGNHRRQTEAEMRKLVGDAVFESYRCVDSASSQFVSLGTTTRGTPVDICAPVARADKRICLGNIEFHYFAGYSGGMKAIMPGVSTREAIQRNHRDMVRAEACAGRLTGNPVREDIEEVAGLCPVHFIVNVVLGEDKKILGAFAGHPVDAHRACCAFLDSLYKVRVERPADVVLVSAGGFPKDINLYQAQKALDNAKQAVADGGTIILVAQCAEGLGDETFTRWMMEADSPKALITRIHETFELGGHKAAAIAMVRERVGISLVSGLEPGLVRKCFMEGFASVQEALDAALAKKGKGARVCVIPYGGSVLPCVD